MTTLGSNRCKGLVFFGLRDVLRELHGTTAVERTLADPRARPVEEGLRYGSLVRGGWYPIPWYTALHAAAADATGDATLAWDVGRRTTLADLTSGPFKVLLKVVSPQFVLGTGARLFSRYYERGEMTVEEQGPRRARARWRECSDFDARLWQDVFGGCVGALEAAGGREVTLRTVSGGRDGDDAADAVATWA